jgi:protoporphyrinogen oxidase
VQTDQTRPGGSGASAGVIGAGALGLAAALRLAEAGVQVTVIEQEPSLGGLATGFRPSPDSQVTLEKFYHHLFRSDRNAINLIDQLGLGPKLEWSAPVTATLRDGRIYPMTPFGIFRFSAVPFVDRIRLIATMAGLKLTPSERPFLGQTAQEWSRRWAGRRVYDALLGPLLAGKFGTRSDEIAMSWLWSRFHERSLSLGYLRGGFQQLYDAIGERIRERGGEIRLGVSAKAISAERGRVEVEVGDERLEFDRLLVTVPERAFIRMAAGLPAGYEERYPGPDFYSAHVLILALDRRLTDAYWINVADPGFPFLVLVEHTNFKPAEDYGGLHLIYLGNYLPPDASVFSMRDSELLDLYLPALKRIAPEFDPSWIKKHWVFQAPFAQPIVTQGYLEKLPPHETPLPGVFFATMAHVYPQDRGQNYSLRLGERMAELLLEDLGAAGRSG